MTRRVGCRSGAAVTALGLTLLAGCLQGNPRPIPPSPLAGAGEPSPALQASQVADVQVAMGRALEKRGAAEQALGVYREALKQDPRRADACARVAVLCDQQGKFKESEEMYRKALAAQPDNADLLCNRGYSLYLQRRWGEAEEALRRALALAPGHRRAHNNLGLVLAQLGRPDDALASFLSAGCTEAERPQQPGVCAYPPAALARGARAL
jgi:Tfp pilus assembly protein PilF